jgi:hypothetical protein
MQDSYGRVRRFTSRGLVHRPSRIGLGVSSTRVRGEGGLERSLVSNCEFLELSPHSFSNSGWSRGHLNHAATPSRQGVHWPLLRRRGRDSSDDRSHTLSAAGWRRRAAVESSRRRSSLRKPARLGHLELGYESYVADDKAAGTALRKTRLGPSPRAPAALVACSKSRLLRIGVRSARAATPEAGRRFGSRAPTMRGSRHIASAM